MYKNLAATLVAACLFSPFHLLAAEPAKVTANVTAIVTANSKPPVKAAFVYVTPVFDMGWTHQHDEGRKAL